MMIPAATGKYIILESTYLVTISELAREEKDQPFRSGAITPDGYIDEDFEEELGSPTQVGNHGIECTRSVPGNGYSTVKIYGF